MRTRPLLTLGGRGGHARHGKKGRAWQGSKHKDAKLKPEQVLEIRKLYAEGGHTMRSLGAKYGIAHSHIRKIVIGEKWKIVI